MVFVRCEESVPISQYGLYTPMVSPDMTTLHAFRLLPEPHSITFRASDNEAIGKSSRTNIPILALESGETMVEERRGG